ncbi:LOW QUALITY PROTEIN: hypothetical protein HID58_071906 [Brassica napus]|uniref:Sugar phosphate transporter domain-containing protein n=2 Tax=Brassica TaxID=3705 RepID=A0ABQ7Z2X6_BRANA|nr:LOW QUALITY PROTEIN: hypothetical protein HID58_071906 [Brassica napus]
MDQTGFQVPIVGFMCSSIGAYIVVKVLKLKPPVSFVFCINIVLVAGDWRKYLDWRIWASLVTDHSMSGSSKKDISGMKRFSSYSAPKRFNLRPTSENIQKLRYQLANPRFGEHHLFFLQSVGRILRLARGCTASSDFVAGDPYHFTLNMPSTHLYMLPAVVDPSGLQRYSDRVVDGIAAVFLALKHLSSDTRGPLILQKRIAHETAAMVHELIGLQDNKVDLRFIGSLPKDQQVEVVLLSEQDSFFKSNMYLGILGMNDFQKVAKSNQNIHTAVTDLLNNESVSDIDRLRLVMLESRSVDATVQQMASRSPKYKPGAMAHELIGLEDNKVDLRAIGSLPKDQQVRMVDDFQQVAKSNQNIQTVEDMARFVDNYPEYKKMQGNVSKHVTLITEMSKLLEARKLMLVSQTEQDLACNGGQGAAYEAVTDLLNNESVSDIDRLRLVMLYALRFEKENPVQLRQLFNKLASRSPKGNVKLSTFQFELHLFLVPLEYSSALPSKVLVQFLLKQGGVEKRTDDLFRNRDLMNIARNMARGLMGVENVYTQHQPPVSNNGEHNHREITRCGLTFCWRSFSTGTEFYADFFAGDPSHFTLNMPSTHLYMLPAVVDPSSLQRYSDRVVDGIAAVFLALKRRPVLRYQRTYDTAKRIAHETAVVIFMGGGTTYEESRSVALQNATNSGIRFILGGTAVLNSKRFLMDLEEAQRISRSGSDMLAENNVLKLKPLIVVEPEDRWRRIFPISFIRLSPSLQLLQLWRKYFDWRIWASLVPIVGGILLTSVTEVIFNMFGFCAALFGCLATSTKTILAESLLHGYKFDSINTVYYMAAFATMILAIPVLLLEGNGIMSWFEAHPSPWSALIIIFISGVLALLSQLLHLPCHSLHNCSHIHGSWKPQGCGGCIGIMVDIPQPNIVYESCWMCLWAAHSMDTHMLSQQTPGTPRTPSYTEKQDGAKSTQYSLFTIHCYVTSSPILDSENTIFSNLLKDTQSHILADSDEHKAVQQVQGVENVYTQHQPLLFQTMESITRGRFVAKKKKKKQREITRCGLTFCWRSFSTGTVVIFMVGGTTYEESRSVALQNATTSVIRFILGGTAVLNSKRFLMDLEEAQRISRSGSHMV